MSDDEIKQATAEPVRLGEAEQPAQADPVVDHHPDHRQAEDDSEGKREKDDPDVVGHDRPGGLDPLVGRDVRPQLVVMDLIDQIRGRDPVGGVGVREHDEERDDRGSEEQRGRRQQVRPCSPIRLRQRTRVKAPRPAPDVPSAPVDDPVSARDEAVQVPAHRLVGPVALSSSQVSRSPAVQSGQGEHLHGMQRVQAPRATASDEVLQVVPVLAAARHELFGPHYGAQNSPMEQLLPDSELVVATPERVSFDYQVAGLGTRAIAQLLDLLILSALLVALLFAGTFAGIVFDSGVVADLIWILGSFVVIFGFFWVSEAMWSGQTIGKKAFRLRAVGDRGEPLTLIQAGIRNVVRIVDFLPYGYGVGLIVLFINGKGKRLGDLAAGTVVVKDSDHVWLWQLPGARPVDFQVASGQDAQMRLPPGYPPPPPPLIPPPPPAPEPAATGPSPYTLASNAESILRRLDPELRRFVGSYAHRRPALGLDLRVQLAGGIQPGLRRAMPDML